MPIISLCNTKNQRMETLVMRGASCFFFTLILIFHVFVTSLGIAHVYLHDHVIHWPKNVNFYMTKHYLYDKTIYFIPVGIERTLSSDCPWSVERILLPFLSYHGHLFFNDI